MKRVGSNKIAIIMLWVIVSVLSVFIGYAVAGAIPQMQGSDMGYGSRLLEVLANPFRGYFNGYSLIGMIVGFIVSEIIFGIVFVIKFSAASTNSEDLVDIAEMAQIKEESKDNEILDEETKNDIVFEDEKSDSEDEIDETDSENVSDDEDKTDDNSKEEIKEEAKEENIKIRKLWSRDKEKQAEEPEKEFTMSQDVFINLYNQGYSNEQIKAMMEITAYIPDIDVHMLTRMFNKNMDPKSIHDYIEIMYG